MITALKENLKEDTPLTQRQAAEFLGRSRTALYTWRKQGLIQAYTLGGRVYYKRSELMDALKKV